MATAILIEHWVLCGDGEQLIWLSDGSEMALLTYLAATAGTQTPHPAMRFKDHLEATRWLAEQAAFFLRASWGGIDHDCRPYPDVPLTVPTLKEVPALPKGVPPIFALSEAPRPDEVGRLKRLAKLRYTESSFYAPATMPGILLNLLRREGLLSISKWEVDAG